MKNSSRNFEMQFEVISQDLWETTDKEIEQVREKNKKIRGLVHRV